MTRHAIGLLVLLLWLGLASSGVAQSGVQAASETDDVRQLITEKTVPPKRYLYSRHAIGSLDEVNRIEWVHGPKMHKRAVMLGLQQAGPIEYHVLVADPVYVDVAIPIAEVPEQSGDDLYKLSQPFRCLSLVFTGSPIMLGEQWSVVRSELEARGYRWSGENRELVINREGFNAQRYVTELQVGIQ